MANKIRDIEKESDRCTHCALSSSAWVANMFENGAQVKLFGAEYHVEDRSYRSKSSEQCPEGY